MIQRRITHKIIFLLLFTFWLVAGGTNGYATEVKEEQNTVDSVEKVQAEELDLGDYQSAMYVGERQLLTVTVLPVGATEQKITYSSEDEQVAAVNGMGRITAKKAGTTTITATCQKIHGRFTLTVEEAQGNTEEQKIEVSDIEIATHEDELEVDKSISLSATVLPTTATETTVSYTSDNPAVATVSSTGEVQGIALGSVTITVTAGTISKSIPLLVKIATSAINLNKSCVILKCGESQKITATVQPAGATQTVSYQSTDTEIAAVTADGTITGEKSGTATVLVTNGDMSNAVTVIVNHESREIMTLEQSTEELLKHTDESSDQAELSLIKQLTSGNTVTVQAAQYPVLTTQILKALYEKQSCLIVTSADYQMKLDGRDIVNYENELVTSIRMNHEKGGLSFKLNDGKLLPGAVTLSFSNMNHVQYVYLYNQAKEKYQQLAIDDAASM